MAKQHVETDSGPVEVQVEGSGPPVLMIHGSPGGSDSSVAMGRFLVDAGFTLIAPSRPGYLETPLDSGRAVDEQADLLDELLEKLGHPTAGVITWSGGGPSGYRLAVRHPGRVSKLVTFASVSQKYDPPKEGLDERLIENTGFGNWILRFMATHAPKTTVSSTLAAEGDLTRGELKELVGEALVDDRQLDVVLTMARVVADHKHRGAGLDNDMARFAAIDSLELERVKAPTFLIHGSADTDVPPAHSEFAASVIPGAIHELMDDGTHLALFVHPECAVFQKKVVDFLS